MSKDTSRGSGKDVSLFKKDKIIGMHQAEKTSKEIAETIRIVLRTVQIIIKNWKDSGKPSSSRKKCGRKKILIDRAMRRELKGLGLNSCVVLRKPLISEANRKKKLQFAREH